jgi:hexosaminidase
VFVNEPADEPKGAVQSCYILVSNPHDPLRVGVDETYSLNISSSGCVLSAKTVYGAYMGLQTLGQAIRFDFDTQRYEVAGTPLVVNDAPKFAWRGILIDTDRHWLSLPTIMQIIDALTYAKLNVLHWHLVDWQSWPMQSAAYPKLWNAAWSKRERYTFSDVSKVVAYAATQGVVVVPEFDTPGHASSMCRGYPELCCSALCAENDNHPLSPVPDANGKNVSLDAIKAVLTELAAVFPGEFFQSDFYFA